MKNILLKFIPLTLASALFFNPNAKAFSWDDCPEEVTYYADTDGDGYGNPNESVVGCIVDGAPIGFVDNNSDCDDSNNQIWYYGELWFDGDGDFYTAAEIFLACFGDFVPAGYQPYPSGEDCDDSNPLLYNGFELFADLDGDGFTAPGEFVCFGDESPSNYFFSPSGLDCDDNDADSYLPVTWYLDADNDGHYVSSVESCFAPSIDYNRTATFTGDCNDSDASAFQQAELFIDNDLDGFSSGSELVCFGSSFPANRPGTTLGEDCDDTNANLNPFQEEICDGLDNNCDGQIDEGIPTATYFADADGDGFGDASNSLVSCSQPDGYVLVTNDCNDNDDLINPEAAEICNHIDDNCDGQIDENGGTDVFFVDSDGDGFGDENISQIACFQPEGFAGVAGDCNDNNSEVNPAATEVCNGIDDNCDGQIDEGSNASAVYFADADGDGFGDAANSIQSCVQPVGYVSNSQDCDDACDACFPNAAEIADNKDNNCNGIVDEGFTRLVDASCGIVLSSFNTIIETQAVSGANNYRYHFTNDSLGFSRVYTRNSSVNTMNVSSIKNLLIGGFTYQVRVAARVGNVWREYGYACSITTPPVPQTSVAAAHCGTTLGKLDDKININAVSRAKSYRIRVLEVLSPQLVDEFEIDSADVEEEFGDELILDKSNGAPRFRFSRIQGVKYSTTYSVSISAFVNGKYGAFGPTCLISTPNIRPAIAASNCGQVLALDARIQLASSVSNANQYEFRLVSQADGSVLSRTTGNNFFRFNQIAGIQEGTTYDVSVRVRAFNVWSQFGSVCQISTPVPPTPQLAASACGKTFGKNANVNLASSIPGATNYAYSFENVNGGAPIYYERGSSATNFKFNNVSGITFGSTYVVSVRAFRNGAWGAWGQSCTITSSTSNRLESDEIDAELLSLSANIYPNPFIGSATISVNSIEESANIVVTDLNGRIVESATWTGSDVTIGTTLQSGVYLVRIINQNEVITSKIIKE